MVVGFRVALDLVNNGTLVCAATSRKIIGQWVRQWRETGSVQVKARTRQNTVRSPENIQRENSLGEESSSISVAAFLTLEFVTQKCATNFTP